MNHIQHTKREYTWEETQELVQSGHYVIRGRESGCDFIMMNPIMSVTPDSVTIECEISYSWDGANWQQDSNPTRLSFPRDLCSSPRKPDENFGLLYWKPPYINTNSWLMDRTHPLAQLSTPATKLVINGFYSE